MNKELNTGDPVAWMSEETLKHCLEGNEICVKKKDELDTDCTIPLYANPAKFQKDALRIEADEKSFNAGKYHVLEKNHVCHTDGSECGVGGYCRLCKFSIESQELDWGDRDDEWTDEIKAAHPLNTGSHDTYAIACEIVHNRHSKFALVALVNCLLRKVQGVNNEQVPDFFFMENDLMGKR